MKEPQPAHGPAPRFPRIDRAIGALEDAAMVVVVAALFAVMAVTVADVVMRYGFNSPLPFAYDLITQYLLVAAFFLALSYTLRAGGHMNVDMLLVSIRSPRARAALRAAGDALAIVFFLALLHAGWVSAHDSWVRGDRLTGPLPWPVWISQAFVPLGVALLLLRLACRVAADVAEFLAPSHGGVGSNR